ncbi:MAG: serine--tRNA ligase [Planctomycetota bacterium]|jgi:seryl-tRNA synthetase
MLDLAFIRENPDKVRKAVTDKGEKADVDAILDLDARRREILKEVEALRSRRNEVSKEVGTLKKRGEDAETLIVEMRRVGDRIKELETGLTPVEDQLRQSLFWVPNVPAPDVPVGEDASGNEEVKRWGEQRKFDFEPRPHWDTVTELGLVDFVRGAKMAGANFPLFTGLGARFERAIVAFMLDLHTTKHGYREILPPFLSNRECMLSTGQLPKLEDDMYRTGRDDLFLIPTAEVPVTNFFRDETLSAVDLPVYLTAYTACFRREAGSYGKDTRGLIRVHQFDKVEMVKFVAPEASYDELEKLLDNAESVLRALELPYRVLKLCTGDLSFAAAKCYDIEAYAPGVDRWLEVSSCSNYEAFQARRANIRFRGTDGKLRFVHTLNGSGLALPRTVIAILENYQNADGSVTIPEALRPFMGGMEKISADGPGGND